MFIDRCPLEVPIFSPTLQEFEHFSSYIAKIESLDAHKIGLAKIIPPKGWQARKSGYQEKQIVQTNVHNPIRQEIQGKNGIYSVYNIQQRSMKLSQFQRLASSHRYGPPASIGQDFEKLEERYWQNLTSIAPIYGADVSGTFYDSTQTIWNVNNLGTILDDLQSESGRRIEGVNTAYLYFGMWKATFAWHTEDMDLYSINYLHFGAPKQWYVIPPSFGKQFEQFAAKHFPNMARRCPGFLRHKMTIIAPSVLREQSIPFSKMTQHEGEFIITFPYAYHAGFNYGYNCAESTNFALERWIEYGKHSVQCTCRHDMVKIGMDRFIAKYQPDLYDDWCRGIHRTRHPETDGSLALPKRQRSLCLTTSVKTASLQQDHQKRIADQRYACIFDHLSKNREQFLEYASPLVRAALLRAKEDHSQRKLLTLTAQLTQQCPWRSEFRTFHALEHSDDYRETILHGLSNYQHSQMNLELLFNHWLSQGSSPCALCYLFTVNQRNDQSLMDVRAQLLFKDQSSRSRTTTADILLICSRCHTHVHQECYESLCFALNVPVPIVTQLNPWYCQRCDLKSKLNTFLSSSLSESNLNDALDDRCTSCFLRGGLLLRSQLSKTFNHAICSLAQMYRSKGSCSSCSYCWSFTPLNCRRISEDGIFMCHQSQCSQTFHLTCALLNGCVTQFDHHSRTLLLYCHQHQPSTWNTPTIISDCSDNDEDEDEEDEDNPAAVGTRVILSDGQLGQILDHQVTYHYAVDFDDGSYSHDMLAEDILDDDPSALTTGTPIRIRWTDGTIYPCKYLGRRRLYLYQIQLNDEICYLPRNEFDFHHRISSDVIHRRQPISKGKRRRRRKPFGMTRKRRRHV